MLAASIPYLTCMTEQVTNGAREFARLGAKARNDALSPAERKLIAQKAVKARWAKAGKVMTTQEEKLRESAVPYSMFQGTLNLADIELPCHVLSNEKRVIAQREITGLLTGNKKGGLDRYLMASNLQNFLPERLKNKSLDQVMQLFTVSQGLVAQAFEGEDVVDICEMYLKARDAGVLLKNQMHLAAKAEIIVRSFAKTGIVALIDEATGYQQVRAKNALQLKFQAFIADELQEWAVMFPEEFWFELARLEGINYSPKSRPLRWGRYIMMFVYDSIDKDIGKLLREKNPNPKFKQNHHQWLKKFGKDKVHDQINKVVTIMKLCKNMEDFRQKFSIVFAKTPAQLELDFS